MLAILCLSLIFIHVHHNLQITVDLQIHKTFNNRQNIGKVALQTFQNVHICSGYLCFCEMIVCFSVNTVK